MEEEKLGNGLEKLLPIRCAVLYRRRIRRRTSEEAFYRRRESIVGRLNLISQQALPDSGAVRVRSRRQRRELQNVMAHNSASDRRCQS